MIQDKELLLKDLCARLPYGVKVAFFNEDLTHHSEPKTLIGIECINNLNYSRLEDEDGNTTIVEFVKPYLFPLSSMTEEQQEEFDRIYAEDMQVVADNLKNRLDGQPYEMNLGHYRHIDWLNKNHFDYRSLIEKSLALDATNLGIYE